jgi:hypothetical protein
MPYLIGLGRHGGQMYPPICDLLTSGTHCNTDLKATEQPIDTGVFAPEFTTSGIVGCQPRLRL